MIAINRPYQVGERFWRILTYILLVIGALTTVAPFIWSVLASFKTRAQFVAWPPVWIPWPPHYENYIKVCTYLPFGRFMLNSLFLSITVPTLQLAFAAPAAYAFARLRFPGRDLLFLAFLGTMMIPGHVTLIPNFILVKYLGWLDTWWALIIPPIFTGTNVFGLFLLRQYFLTIPRELEESARIDGCSWFQTFLRVILPNAKPAIATFFIIAFKNEWNSFIWPLIVMNSYEKMPIQVGLAYLASKDLIEWEVVLAGATLALIPIIIVFMFAQRYFIESMARAGLGGR
ncbi:multiple sugar transport system permease protein [Thermanaeromonas toyohensis ToBE]|uniref:Multiple sugar transport system permease protein n=1 Tax=Thermanaeromonas toyohensis ToBE TaxID=698762 RepID=A0A1W1VVM6_9FIRM|nr:carbohydrate ABC transporter permease [Thermanaeromonas toyohensis]SMB97398.1 multiple sugar transport system permease protein [Thermanaeromonas toyohensis ToBE]